MAESSFDKGIKEERAERVLPSRDAVDEALTFAPLTDIAEDSIFDIARAYVSGRLVDREAIDREAMKNEFWKWLPDSFPADSVFYDRALDAALDVALGVKT